MCGGDETVLFFCAIEVEEMAVNDKFLAPRRGFILWMCCSMSSVGKLVISKAFAPVMVLLCHFTALQIDST